MSLVCVVADDPAMQKLLARALANAGLQVEIFGCGASVLLVAPTRSYDLVMLDLGLSDADGIAVLREIRQVSPVARVMVVSARDSAPCRVQCLDEGACDFVAKPFDVSELLARVRAHLRAQTRNHPPFLPRGSVTLDLQRHELVLPDRTARLANMEFLLLRYLMARAGQVCTRGELLKEVWGYEFPTGDNLVDKYVSRLRAKLPHGVIETVRSVGYSYAAG